mgnify:CR=1 FL=1
MDNNEILLRQIFNKLAELKASIDPDDEMSLEEYDILYGEVEEIQSKVFDVIQTMGYTL